MFILIMRRDVPFGSETEGDFVPPELRYAKNLKSCEFAIVLFTKKYLELNLGENIWGYRLTLDEKGHCSY